MNEQHEQLQLDLQGELDLESIRREYESEQLWKDARYLAETTGYTAQEMEDLTQELALVGLQADVDVVGLPGGDVARVGDHEPVALR